MKEKSSENASRTSTKRDGKLKYLICYDISSDKYRNWLRKYLIKKGGVYLQKSVVFLNAPQKEKEKLLKKIENRLSLDEKTDNVFIYHLKSAKSASVYQFGYQFPFSAFLGEEVIEVF